MARLSVTDVIDQIVNDEMDECEAMKILMGT